jgi:hypothetical protein
MNQTLAHSRRGLAIPEAQSPLDAMPSDSRPVSGYPASPWRDSIRRERGRKA